MRAPLSVQDAVALWRQNRLLEAESLLRAIIQANPTDPDALHALGVILLSRGDVAAAVPLLQRVVAAVPDAAEPLSNLGEALRLLGRLADARAVLERAVALDGARAASWNNLGGVLVELRLYGRGIAALRRALQLQPRLAEAQANLGVALRGMGNVAGAIDAFRAAIALAPHHVGASSGLLYALHFSDRHTPQQVLEEHRAWWQRTAASLDRPPPPRRRRGGRVRIGYVSPDFRDHVVGRHFACILPRHDRRRFEVFCYHAAPTADALTDALATAAEHWHDISAMDDESAAALVREHGIDLLVDMAQQTRGSRLLVFARRPAPVQAAHFGYPATSGLATMDWRVGDPILDPPGSESACFEKIVRLDRCWWCFEPEPIDLPTRGGKEILFGTLNHPAKCSPTILRLWSKILLAVPGSRLVMLGPDEPADARYQLDILGEAGVDEQRIILVPRMAQQAYMRQWGQIDIGLDPYPYNGHTTTLDALWMGTPVVSLSGASSVSRGGASILRAVGLERLATSRPEDYVRVAIELATDRDALSALHGSLRDRVARSPLVDCTGYTRSLERAWLQAVAG